MERQEENEQQYSGADKAPKLVPILHAGNKHRFKTESENS
jgi:hypothetical protein